MLTLYKLDLAVEEILEGVTIKMKATEEYCTDCHTLFTF